MATNLIALTNPDNTSGLISNYNPTSGHTQPNQVINVKYETSGQGKWIYCNYPEQLLPEARGDSATAPKYINRQQVAANVNNQLFYSYHNCYYVKDYQGDWGTNNRFKNLFPSGTKFGIRVYNPSTTSSLNLTISNYGHSTNGTQPGGGQGNWDIANMKHWEDFYNGRGTLPAGTPANPIQIPKGESHWIEQLIEPGKIFSGVMRFSVTQTAIIEIYIYEGNKTYTSVNTASAQPYPYKIQPLFENTGVNDEYTERLRGQFSGFGRPYFYTADEILLNNYNGQYSMRWYETHSSYYQTNQQWGLRVNGATKTDLVDLWTVPGSISSLPLNNNNGTPLPWAKDTKSVPTVSGGITSDGCLLEGKYTQNNLGNWCVQYSIPIKYVNGSTRVRIRGYVRKNSDKNTSYIIMRSGGTGNVTRKVTLTGNNPNTTTWKFCDQIVEPYDTVADSYQFILGTNSTAGVRHIWETSQA